MTFRNRISDGTKAALIGVFFLMALVGFFAGTTVQRVVVPGPERTRIVTQHIPGPTVTIRSTVSTTRSTTMPTTAPTVRVTVPGPTATLTRTRTVTRPRPVPGPTVTRTRTVSLPGPTVTVTSPPLVLVRCFQVGLLGLVSIACP